MRNMFSSVLGLTSEPGAMPAPANILRFVYEYWAPACTVPKLPCKMRQCGLFLHTLAGIEGLLFAAERALVIEQAQSGVERGALAVHHQLAGIRVAEVQAWFTGLKLLHQVTA